jgi:hypothetical protein
MTKKITYGKFPNRFFIGEIISFEADRQFIIDTVEQLHSVNKRKIGSTKLLYSLSLMKVQNPHLHIDNVPNYIIIITLEKCDEKGNPYLLALHSERAL